MYVISIFVVDYLVFLYFYCVCINDFHLLFFVSFISEITYGIGHTTSHTNQTTSAVHQVKVACGSVRTCRFMNMKVSAAMAVPPCMATTPQPMTPASTGISITPAASPELSILSRGLSPLTTLDLPGLSFSRSVFFFFLLGALRPQKP